MKRLLVLLGCCTILAGLVGCQGPTALPPDIAGTWKADNSSWKIVLSPEGKVWLAPEICDCLRRANTFF